MVELARALAIGGILWLGPYRTTASATPSDTSGLQFLGFRAGARLEELDVRLRSMGGPALRCRQSRIDPRVSECRARLRPPGLAARIELWVSAIDSLAGVITISGVLRPEQLEAWRQELQGQYGTVGPKIQGTQWMLQWVRRGRMLRLTWRLEATGKAASVSLVDGRVLDDWGRSRILPSPAVRSSRGSADASS